MKADGHGRFAQTHCTYDDSVGIDKKLMEKLGLRIPDVYIQRDMMTSLSGALKGKSGAPFFCSSE